MKSLKIPFRKKKENQSSQNILHNQNAVLETRPTNIKTKRMHFKWILADDRNFSNFDDAVKTLEEENWRIYKKCNNRSYFKCKESHHCKARM
jgi:hypothetical protein